jgi:hypothetical protein
MTCLLPNFGKIQHQFDMKNGSLAWGSMHMGLKELHDNYEGTMNYYGRTSFSLDKHFQLLLKVSVNLF